MRFPSIKDVAAGLRDINANVEAYAHFNRVTEYTEYDGVDVRLCVWADGQWCMRSGLVDYDQSHSDYCGASSVPGVINGRTVRFNSREVARDLIDQCKEQWAMDSSLECTDGACHKCESNNG